VTVALFPDNYACPGGCGGIGYLLADDSHDDLGFIVIGAGWMVACEDCNPDAQPIIDPQYAEVPY
jgi:hypothetical protein